MGPLTLDQAREVNGGTLLDAQQQKVGKITDIYIDSDTNRPEWALVHTGMFGGRESFVPLAEAQTAGGNSLQVPYTKDQIKGAPNAEPDGELSEQEEQTLYQHYGLNYSEAPSDSGLPSGGQQTHTGTGTGTVGHDVSGPETDNAMTRSEERLRVGVVSRPSKAVRLRKFVVTENVTQTVPVTHEEVRISREPITDANIGNAMDGPAISEEEHEVILTEERPVVSKEAIPVERIRLDKEVVTEQETVTGEIRKEQIELEEPQTTQHNR